MSKRDRQPPDTQPIDVAIPHQGAPGPAAAALGGEGSHTPSPSLSAEDRERRLLELQIRILQLELSAARRRAVAMPPVAGRWRSPGEVAENSESRSHYLNPGPRPSGGHWWWQATAAECAEAMRRAALRVPERRVFDPAQAAYRYAVERGGGASPSVRLGGVG